MSVILPVRNAASHVATQLAALAAQTYPGAWELLVVDNGCTDTTVAVVESWREQLPSLRIIDARRFQSVSWARSVGAAAAGGEFLAFCDADDVVSTGWLEALTDAGVEADLVGGCMEFETLNDPLRRAWREPNGSHMTELTVVYGFLPFVSGGNCGIWAEIAEQLGWDQSFRSGGADIDFTWRALLAGYKVQFAPEAVAHLRYRRTITATVRQHLAYGASEPHLYKCFGPAGMPRRTFAQARATWRWLATYLPTALRNPGSRGDWFRLAALNLGRVWGSLRWRVVYL